MTVMIGRLYKLQLIDGSDYRNKAMNTIDVYKRQVRAAAKKFEVSKSTVHKDLVDRLPNLNGTLAEEVRKVLDGNKAERHIRGGLATKAKYEEVRKRRDCTG